MTKPFYYDHVCHALRFYASVYTAICPEDQTAPSTFRSDADRQNWQACHEVLKILPAAIVEVLVLLYKSREPLRSTVPQLADRYHIPEHQLWTIIKRTERNVARKRGLI